MSHRFGPRNLGEDWLEKSQALCLCLDALSETMFNSCGKETSFTGARGIELLSAEEVKVKQKAFDSSQHSPFSPTKMKDGAKSGLKRSRDDPGTISQTPELPSSLGTRCFVGSQVQAGSLTTNPSS